MPRKRRRTPLTSNGRGAHCTYCDRRLESKLAPSKLAATKDHVHPKSKGGIRLPGNKVWCCRQCNMLKADMSETQWKYFMRHNPEWWRRPEYQVGGVPGHRRRQILIGLRQEGAEL
ncbi:MAG: HNH endonuclease [Methyloceanibacter sp.]